MGRLAVSGVVTIVIAIIAFVVGGVTDSSMVGKVVFAIGMLAFLAQGYRNIPANPPNKGALTFLGERTGKYLNEGWGFFPLYPWVFGVILVDMTKKNFDVQPADVRTATDMAEILVEVSLTITPDKNKLTEYLNAGGEVGVKAILEDITTEAIREFAADPNREPNTWKEAVKMQREFLAEVVAIILGNPPGADPATAAGIVSELRKGNGTLALETLGVILNRVNVTKIQPEAKLAAAAQKEAIEERERAAEEVELRHVRARLAELMAPPPVGPEYSKEQALEIIQTERGKVTKGVTEHKFSVSPDVQEMVKGVAAILKGGR